MTGQAKQSCVFCARLNCESLQEIRSSDYYSVMNAPNRFCCENKRATGLLSVTLRRTTRPRRVKFPYTRMAAGLNVLKNRSIMTMLMEKWIL